MSSSSFPDDFIPESILTKDCIQHNLQIVAGGWVAVEVDAAGRFEDAMEFDEADRHHHEVGHHVVAADEALHGVDHLADMLGRGLDDLGEGGFGGLVPGPGVVEGFDLGRRRLAAFLLEEDVVGAVGVERRVEVDQVD
jgi:hypothetical protein